MNYKERKWQPLECGGTGERENGNGSLMRILPIVLYVAPEKILDDTKNDGKRKCETMDQKMEWIHNVSSLTHAHRRSLMGCGIYAHVAWKLLEMRGQGDLMKAVQDGIDAAVACYEEKTEFRGILELYDRVRDIRKLAQCERAEIWGTGYVIATLEAALWSLVTTKSYKECVLTAVNLGNDTDTVGAVAGSLAGLWYGMDQIPDEWLNVIARRKWILQLCEKFEKNMEKFCQVDCK